MNTAQFPANVTRNFFIDYSELDYAVGVFDGDVFSIYSMFVNSEEAEDHMGAGEVVLDLTTGLVVADAR